MADPKTNPPGYLAASHVILDAAKDPDSKSKSASRKFNWRRILLCGSDKSTAKSVSASKTPKTDNNGQNLTNNQLAVITNPAPTQGNAVEGKLGMEEEAAVVAPITELWNEAWDTLKAKDAALVKDYEECIESTLSRNSQSHAIMSTIRTAQESTIAFSGLGKVQRAQVMKALVDKRTQELKQGQWKVGFGDNQFAVKDFIKPVVAVIDWSKDYIDKAAQASPYSSVAWAGVSLLLPLVLNHGQQEIARAKDLENVAALLRQCSVREVLYSRKYDTSVERSRSSTSVHVNYREELKNLYVTILTFQATCLCYLTRGTAIRIARDMVVWDGWDKLSQKIDIQSAHMESMEEQWRDFKLQEQWDIQAENTRQKIAIETAIEDEVSRIRTAIETTQRDTTRLNLLEWLSPEDFSKRYNNIREKYEDSTGAWLIDHKLYKKWKTNPSSFLWLHGKAGSGKSYLSSTAIAELEAACSKTPYETFAYYFFSFSETGGQDTTRMLSSIIRQLCGSRPDTPDWLTNLGATFRDKGARPSLKHVEEALLDAVAGFDAVYLIIDAIDECPESEEGRSTLLRSLAKLQGSCPANVHLLVTSRKEPDIEAKLAKLLVAPTAEEIDLWLFRDAVSHDINIYLEQRLHSDKFDGLSEENKKLAQEKLLEKSDGMFQYVALQLAAIQNSYSEDIPTLLANLPEGLDATYVRMLENIDPQHRELANRVLIWVALSRNSLDAKELAEAVVVEPLADPTFSPAKRLKRLEDPSGLLKLLPGLLDVVKTSWGSFDIRFTHFSVKEFLLSDRISQLESISRYAIREDVGNLLIAESCLCYHLYACDAVGMDDMSDRTLENFPLWYYSAWWWMWHLSLVPEHLWTPSLKERVKSVLAPKTQQLLKMVQISNPSGRPRAWEKKLSDLASPLYYIAAYLYPDYRLCCLLLEGLDAEQLQIQLHPSGTEQFQTALQAAASKSNAKIAALLVDHGVDINNQGGFYGNALQAAASRGSFEIASLLLDHGADVNAEGGFYGNALQAGASCGSLDVVRLLLDHKADINTQGGYWSNALQAAASQNSPEVAALLLDRGADVNSQGGEHGNALQAACSSDGSLEVATLLLNRGANVNTHGGYLGSPLQAASSSGSLEVVRLLLDHGADVNTQGGEYDSALQAASYSDSSEIVGLLLDRGAKVNAQGGLYGNALQAASARGSLRVATLLLGHGADINAQGEYGQALQAATLFGAVEIVQLLLDRGAEVNAQGGTFGSALNAAQHKGAHLISQRRRIAEILIAHGAKEDLSEVEQGKDAEDHPS